MRIIFTFLGLICIVIGAVGAIIPILPTTPFLLLAALFLAKGSARFNNCFISTILYRNNLEPLTKGNGMTPGQKAKILTLASVMLLAALYFCPSHIGKVIILAVIAAKYYVFLFRIKTIK